MNRRDATTNNHTPPAHQDPYVIAICPCCASPVDAEVIVEMQTLECAACGQTWHMQVDPDHFKQYALS